MTWLITHAIAVGAGFLTHMFWGSTIRPWLLKETHVVVSGAGTAASDVLAALKKKL